MNLLLVRTCNYERANVQRLIARGVVLMGVIVCGLAVLGVFTGMGYTTNTPMATAGLAAIPMVIAIVVFIIGLFYEYLAAAILAVGAVLIGVWGLLAGWEPGSWMAMIVFVIGPMILSGALYWFAAQTQTVCELQEAGGKDAAAS